MAFGSAIVELGAEPGGRIGLVGAAVASRMVGAGAMAVGAPAGRRGTVGAGARGGPATGAVGAEGAGVIGAVGTGAFAGGAIGTVADGTDGGASDAFKVTRMVSFLSGTLEVCLEGASGSFSFSLMRSQGLRS